MDLTSSFRAAMFQRLLKSAGLVVLVAPALHSVACGTSGGSGGSGGSSGGLGAGGQCGTASAASSSGGSGGDSSTTAAASSSSGYVLECGPPSCTPDPLAQTRCLPKDASDACPDQAAMNAAFKPQVGPNGGPPCEWFKVQCGPEIHDGLCCYGGQRWPLMCSAGRPFLVDDCALTATIVHAERGWAPGLLRPDLTGLDSATRSALAAAWAADALLEHASIAAFARFSLELLAIGAPADLVAAAYQAAQDEVRHAQMCFALAQGYSGAPMAPSAFPFDGTLALRSDLAAFAASTAREGCVEETLSAILAAEQLARATDPAVRQALAAIAEDEARHAELAWRTVTWTIAQGGAPVRDAIAAVLAELGGHPSRAAGDIESPASALGAHGRLDAVASRSARERGLQDVVRPCFAALLASPQVAASEAVATA